MEVIDGRPPNFEAILKVFPMAANRGVMFTYGAVLFAPGFTPASVPPALLHAHEPVHCERQGSDIDGWWTRYLVDEEFRFEEERLAHIAEYRWLAERSPSRQVRRQHLRYVAQRLSGGLYNRMVTFEEACRQIKLGAGSI